ncbi:MAG: DUF4162 domain-containing protein, partial [Leifsonia sp.]
TGTLSQMRHLTRTSFRVATKATLADVQKISGVHNVRAEADQLVFDADTDAVNGVLAALTKAGVSSLAVTPPSLEELFLRHYGDRIETEPAA